MLSAIHNQYHTCWCTGDFRSQYIRHSITLQCRNIPTLASEVLLITLLHSPFYLASIYFDRMDLWLGDMVRNGLVYLPWDKIHPSYKIIHTSMIRYSCTISHREYSEQWPCKSERSDNSKTNIGSEVYLWTLDNEVYLYDVLCVNHSSWR